MTHRFSRLVSRVGLLAWLWMPVAHAQPAEPASAPKLDIPAIFGKAGKPERDRSGKPVTPARPYQASAEPGQGAGAAAPGGAAARALPAASAASSSDWKKARHQR